MPDPQLLTVGDVLYWSYSNMSMASAAAWSGDTAYAKKHFIIRNRTWSGLRNGKVAIGSPVKDFKVKARHAGRCAHCGSQERVSNDHLMATARGGRETADNIVSACRSCNSSKGKRDLMEWYASRQAFPSLFVLRLYLKELIAFCKAGNLMDTPLEESTSLPFDPALIPREYPPPLELRC